MNIGAYLGSLALICGVMSLCFALCVAVIRIGEGTLEAAKTSIENGEEKAVLASHITNADKSSPQTHEGCNKEWPDEFFEECFPAHE